MTKEEFDRWPKCAVPACANKSCLRLSSKYCWPHSSGNADEVLASLKNEEIVGASDSSLNGESCKTQQMMRP
jgi:hypothetical protein